MGERLSKDAHFVYPACGKVKIDNCLLIRRKGQIWFCQFFGYLQLIATQPKLQISTIKTKYLRCRILQIL